MIATAVEEQTGTTNEMNRNVAEAAQGSGAIAASVDGIVVAADDARRQGAPAQASAEALARTGVDLQEAISRYAA